MAEFSLVPHPDFPSVAITSITVEAERTGFDMIELAFWMRGDTEQVMWPDLADQQFTDELWKHSCCEAFIADHDDGAYIELNAATSMLWAAYAFDGYRSGMTPLPTLDPVLAGGARPDRVMLAMSVRLPMVAGATMWRVGLTAIIEAKNGSKSYWALAHAPGPPDFHNADCFTARLPAPELP